MKKSSFLNKLKRKKIILLVEPSREIASSYLNKSGSSLKAAKLLLKEDLLEESVSMIYYATYYCLLAFLFKCGIKSENHTASILLLKIALKEPKLSEMLLEIKKERIDKQYYVDFCHVKSLSIY